MVEITTDKDFYVGEHLSGIITVTVSPELKEADIRLDFELPSGEKFCSPQLSGVDENYQTQYAVPQQCLDRMGASYIQAIVSLGAAYIEKSDVLKIIVNKSVNAVEDFAEDEPDLMAELLNEFGETKEKVEELLDVAVTEENIEQAVEDYMAENPVNTRVTVKTWTEEDFKE